MDGNVNKSDAIFPIMLSRTLCSKTRPRTRTWNPRTRMKTRTYVTI